MRIFGRNLGCRGCVAMDKHRAESERVLKAVSFEPPLTRDDMAWIAEIGHELPATHLDELGAYEAWAPYTSVFQRTAFEGPYGDIVSILARIESRVVFND